MAKNIHETQIELTAITEKFDSAMLVADKRMRKMEESMTAMGDRNSALKKKLEKAAKTQKLFAEAVRNSEGDIRQINKALKSHGLEIEGASSATAKMTREQAMAARAAESLSASLKGLSGDAPVRDLSALEKQIKETMAAMRGDARAIEKVNAELSEYARKVGLSKKETDQLNRAVVGSATGMQKFTAFMTQQTGVAGNHKKGLKGVTQSLYNMRLGYLGATTAGALLLKGAIDTAVRFDNLKLTMIAASGGVKEAGIEMARARGIAQKYGIEIEELTRSYGKFMAASRGTALEGEKARKVFEATARASRIYGLSTDELQGTLKALEQMVSKGTVQMEELKNQLGDRLPGALGLAARSMGVTRAELFKMIEQGQVAAEDFLPKFAEELNRATESSKDFVDKSPAAAFQRLSNSIKLVEASLANSGLIDFMANISNGLANLIGRFSDIEDMAQDPLTVKRFELTERLLEAKSELAQLKKQMADGGAVRGGRFQRAAEEVRALEAEMAKVSKRQDELDGKNAGPKSLLQLGTLGGPAVQAMLDISKAANFGVDKYVKKLNELEAKWKQVSMGVTSASKEARDELLRVDEELASGISSNGEALTADQIAEMETRRDALLEISAQFSEDLLDVEKDYNTAKAELERQRYNAELSRRKEASRKLVKEALDRAQELSKLDDLLGKDLAAEVTGEASFGDIEVPNIDLLEGISSAEEFNEFFGKIKNEMDTFAGVIKNADFGTDQIAASAEAFSRLGKAAGDALKGADLSQLFSAESSDTIDQVKSKLESFQATVETMFADEERKVQLLDQMGADPELLAERYNLLNQLRDTFIEEQIERDEYIAERKQAQTAMLLGIDQNQLETLNNWEKASANDRLQTAVKLGNNLVSQTRSRNKKLGKLAVVSTQIAAFAAAVNAARDTPGEGFARIAAYAAVLATGLGAVAQIKSLSGGGGGGGSSASSVSSSSISSSNVTSASAPERGEFGDGVDRTTIVELRGLEPDAQYSGKQIERIIEGINEASRDGRGLIEVS